jgi:hypothetical protein
MKKTTQVDKYTSNFTKILTQILVLVFLANSKFSNAQWTGTNPITTSSFVGISTTTPSAYLHVSPTYSGPFGVLLRPLILADYDDFGTMKTTFTALNNGQVGVGLANPSETFHVLGTTLLEGNSMIKGSLKINDGASNQFEVTNSGLLIARQIDVHLDPIPDYVFHAAFSNDSAFEYKMKGTYIPMTLAEVDTFVQEYRHLPGIKSAEEYKQLGSINLGELNLKLLEKVEELYLYNIDLMKQIAEMQKKIAALEKANELELLNK